MKTEYPSQAPEAVRKRIEAPKTNVTDDSMSVEYNQTNDRVIVAHTEDENNISQIQADSRGVWYHKNVGGSWSTIPQAVNVGGTGATNAADARYNLGIEKAANSTETYSVIMDWAGNISGGGTSVSFTVYTKGYFLNRINSISVTSCKVVMRGINGYIDNLGTYTEHVGRSNTRVTATKTGMNCFRISISKTSGEFSNMTNNTPVTVSGTLAVRFT